MAQESKRGNAQKLISRRGSCSLGGGSIAFVWFPSQAAGRALLLWAVRSNRAEMVLLRATGRTTFRLTGWAMNGEAVAPENAS